MEHPVPLTDTQWIQTVALPVQCVRVAVECHQMEGTDRWCFDLEVSEPHTRELLARITRPTERYSEVLTLTQQISVELRYALQQLLDPDPF